MSYATLDDLSKCGLPLGALEGVAFDVQTQALEDASALADGFIADGYTLPLAPPFDRSLVRAVCRIAAFELLVTRGFNPDSPQDQSVKYLREEADRWLVRVANKQVKLNVVQSSPESVQPDIATSEPRGYGDIIGDGSTNFPGVLI